MPNKTVTAFGWDQCARLANAQSELIVSLDVGPRILSYTTEGSANVLGHLPEELGASGEPEFRVRGGHRLWVAPETEISYAPDNGPVNFDFREPNALFVETPVSAPWGIRKSMALSLAAEGSAVRIDHALTNEGAAPVTVASWALTVMAPGGLEIIPQPPLGEHGKGPKGREFLPERVMVPWSFTDFSDPRWKFGRRFFTLRPVAGMPATKLGLAHLEPWVAYLLPDALFVKTLAFEPGATYPDFGCNLETFTKDTFLEIESLSPLKTLAPGNTVGHSETWHLLSGVSQPDSLEEGPLEEWLQPLLKKLGL